MTVVETLKIFTMLFASALMKTEKDSASRNLATIEEETDALSDSSTADILINTPILTPVTTTNLVANKNRLVECLLLNTSPLTDFSDVISKEPFNEFINSLNFEFKKYTRDKPEAGTGKNSHPHLDLTVNNLIKSPLNLFKPEEDIWKSTFENPIIKSRLSLVKKYLEVAGGFIYSEGGFSTGRIHDLITENAEAMGIEDIQAFREQIDSIFELMEDISKRGCSLYYKAAPAKDVIKFETAFNGLDEKLWDAGMFISNIYSYSTDAATMSHFNDLRSCLDLIHNFRGLIQNFAVLAMYNNGFPVDENELENIIGAFFGAYMKTIEDMVITLFELSLKPEFVPAFINGVESNKGVGNKRIGNTKLFSETSTWN